MRINKASSRTQASRLGGWLLGFEEDPQTLSLPLSSIQMGPSEEPQAGLTQHPSTLLQNGSSSYQFVKIHLFKKKKKRNKLLLALLLGNEQPRPKEREITS